MEILHNTPYMKMPVLFCTEIIEECSKICLPSMDVQVLEDVLCTLPFYRTSDFG